MKIIEYSEYCNKCKYYKLEEIEDPCNECLNTPAQEESRKPIKFEEEIK